MMEGGGGGEIGRGPRVVCADLITGRGLSKCTYFRRLLLSMRGDLRRAVDDRVTSGLLRVSVGENHEFTTASTVGVEYGLLMLALLSNSKLSRYINSCLAITAASFGEGEPSGDSSFIITIY